MSYKTLFFDLDDTLYPHTAGLWDEIRRRMDVYMHERLKLPLEEIPILRKTLLEKYGTTLRGLQNTMQVDSQDFLGYVHDIRVNQYLVMNDNLKRILQSLPQKRWVLTNSDVPHAQRVLNALGLQECFQGIIDVNALEFIPKPDPVAFQKSLQLAEAEASSSIFFDDAVRNLTIAHQMGFTTVLVSPTAPAENNNFHFHLKSLEDLPQVMPWLWENRNPGRSNMEKRSG